MTGPEAIMASPYFSLSENWGDPNMVHPDLVTEATEYRRSLGHRLHISPVDGAVYATGGHSESSWHKCVEGRNSLAMAMDIFPECDLPFAWITALRFGFNGIGVYPFYRLDSRDLQGMLHLDIRPIGAGQPGRELWWRSSDLEYHWMRTPEDIQELLETLAGWEKR